MSTVISAENYRLDTSTATAFAEILESQWPFNIYSVKRDYVMKVTADDLFNYFKENYPESQYRVFYGNFCYFWSDNYSIRFRGTFMERSYVNKRYDDDIIVTGRQEIVEEIINKFDDFFKDEIIADHLNVDMIVRGAGGGLDTINLPIKNNRKFIPEMYPIIPNPYEYINDFFNSSANVLILIGDAGLGKSAFINEMILSARKPTQIVFDKEIMKSDSLYTNFINQSLRNDGGLMVMEDADTLLADRIVDSNTNMARLLNLSDGIVDTSGAKFIFSANLKEKSEIDAALIRPGRCFDVLEFRPLTRDEAIRASEAIGKDLYDDTKSEYTVAEIFNSKNNRREKKFKVGFA